MKRSSTNYHQILNHIDQGFFLFDVIFEKNDRPVDVYCVEANAAATRILGSDFTGKRLREIGPNYGDSWYELFGRVALTGESVRTAQYAEPSKKWYSFYVFKVGGPRSRRIGTIFLDISDLKLMEKELQLPQDKLV